MKPRPARSAPRSSRMTGVGDRRDNRRWRADPQPRASGSGPRHYRPPAAAPRARLCVPQGCGGGRRSGRPEHRRPGAAAVPPIGNPGRRHRRNRPGSRWLERRDLDWQARPARARPGGVEHVVERGADAADRHQRGRPVRQRRGGVAVVAPPRRECRTNSSRHAGQAIVASRHNLIPQLLDAEASRAALGVAPLNDDDDGETMTDCAEERNAGAAAHCRLLSHPLEFAQTPRGRFHALAPQSRMITSSAARVGPLPCWGWRQRGPCLEFRPATIAASWTCWSS